MDLSSCKPGLWHLHLSVPLGLLTQKPVCRNKSLKTIRKPSQCNFPSRYICLQEQVTQEYQKAISMQLPFTLHLFTGTSHSRVSESYLKAAVLHATSVPRQTHERVNTQACHSALQSSSHRAYQLQNTSCGRSRVSCLEQWQGRAPLLCDSATARGARCEVSLCNGSHLIQLLL